MNEEENQEAQTQVILQSFKMNDFKSSKQCFRTKKCYLNLPPNFIDFLMENMCCVQSQRSFNTDPPSQYFGSNIDNEEMVKCCHIINKAKNICLMSFSIWILQEPKVAMCDI